MVDGRPQDVRACVESLVARTGATILALDLGNVDGAGDVLGELAERHPERIRLWRVAETPDWQGGARDVGGSRAKLLQLDTAEVHVLMETSLVLDGDALTPLIAAVKEGAVAAGWQGLEPAESGEGWRQAGPGRVRALRGDLMAVRRSAALGRASRSRPAMPATPTWTSPWPCAANSWCPRSTCRCAVHTSTAPSPKHVTTAPSPDT